MVRAILSTNVKALRDQRYAHLGSVTARNKALAVDAGMRLSQLQRIIARELGTSIDYVEFLAASLKVRPQDLLTPYFTIQPTSSQAEAPEPERL